ncbi:hypothetical protein BJY52DRAFT_1418591 [Lactarius psammicola]|nr:hypothetical protein BJY52DRAFT_1418591 [Lactarius psammicola]
MAVIQALSAMPLPFSRTPIHPEKKQLARRHLLQSLQHDPLHQDTTMASEPTLVAYVLVASAAMHDVPSAASERASAGNGKLKVQPRWHYARELHKIVDDSGIVLPYSTRATWPGLQPAGRGEGRKQLMSVLNKTAEVPPPYGLNTALPLRGLINAHVSFDTAPSGKTSRASEA